ncbi:helix-turn-helix transcriptional regulator [Plantactinospora sp. B5E13]|uniref:helix-turn-helix transcriptional regulator n=1 Tax=unclassified Plantactinospora TaxID=2631981 RepID=UPI00325DDA63
MTDQAAARRIRLGQLVRQARHQAGETIEGLAARAKMSPVTWRNVESGARVKVFSLGKVEKVLGWQPGTIEDYLATGEEPGGSGRSEELIDWVLALDRPDSLKVIIIRALRQGGDPIDAVLQGTASPAEKVAAIETLRAGSARR